MLHPNINRILREMESVGLFGTTQSEILDRIVTDWIWDNQERLFHFGITIEQPKREPAKRGKR